MGEDREATPEVVAFLAGRVKTQPQMGRDSLALSPPTPALTDKKLASNFSQTRL